MGQYWQYVNIDDKQIDGGGGKLGEFFFGSQSEVIERLAIPAYPVNKKFRGSWAGARLICLGDNARYFPKGVMTSREIAELKELESEMPLPSALQEISREAPGSIPYSKAFSSNYIWVLRNLNKKEYVRSSGIPSFDTQEEKLSYGNQGLRGCLGQVLLSRIGWSSDSSCNICYQDEDHELQLHDGPWAGDRFDVRVFDECEEEMRNNGWEDVTQVAARQLFDLYRSEYGASVGEYEPEPEDAINF